MAIGKNIKGITIEFNGDTTKLGKALKEVETKAKGVDTSLKNVNRALKFNPGNTELLAQKQQLLGQKISQTKEKLEALRTAQAKMDDDPAVDKTSQDYMELRRQIIETESQLKHFETELKKVDNYKFEQLGKQFQNVGKKMTDVGKTITKRVSAPVAAGLGAAVKVTMDFDSAMSQVAATMGKTNADLEKVNVTSGDFSGTLRDLAVEMGSKTAFSATEAAEALNYMALAGYSAQESADMLPGVLSLAAAGNMDLAQASDMVTDSQTALGLSAEETKTLIDQMAKTSSKSNTSVEQLGEAILTVGGTAKSMAGGTEELNAVLGVLADNGIKGSEGGTILRNTLLSLGSPTDKAAKQLEALGVSVYDAEGNMKDMRELMPELAGALDGLTGEERTKALSAIFNKRDLKGVNALLSTSTERWGELGTAIEESGGAAEQMADTQLDNLGGSLTILKSALEGAAINIGEQLVPAIKTVAEWITALVAKFNEMPEGVQKFVAVAGVILAALGPVLVILGTLIGSVGRVISILPKLISGFQAVGTAFKALSGILAANPWMLVAAAAIAAIILIVKNWDTIKAFFIKLWNSVKTIFTAAWNVIKKQVLQVWNSLKAAAVAIWTGIKTFFTTILNIYKTIFKTAFNAIKTIVTTVFSAVSGFIKRVVNGWKTIFRTAFNAIKTVATNVWNGIKRAIVTPIETARDTIKKIIDKIKGFFNFKVKLPHIKLPHFSIRPSGWQIGDLLKGSIPSLGIDWYAKGGIFTSPTIIGNKGFGEAGAEAALPLDILWDQMSDMFRDMADRIVDGVNAAGGMDGAVITTNVILDGKVVGRAVTPVVNNGLYDRSVLDRRRA